MTCDRSTLQLHVLSCYVRGRGHASRVLPLTKEGAPACDQCVTVPVDGVCVSSGGVRLKAWVRLRAPRRAHWPCP